MQDINTKHAMRPLNVPQEAKEGEVKQD